MFDTVEDFIEALKEFISNVPLGHKKTIRLLPADNVIHSTFGVIAYYKSPSGDVAELFEMPFRVSVINNIGHITHDNIKDFLGDMFVWKDIEI